MANKKIKFTKEQIINSDKYGEYYVLREYLKENQTYTLDEIEEILNIYRKVAK